MIKKIILTDILLLQIKDKKHEKNSVVNFLELIQVKKVMMQIMKFVECKKLEKESNKKIKELQDEIKKLQL